MYSPVRTDAHITSPAGYSDLLTLEPGTPRQVALLSGPGHIDHTIRQRALCGESPCIVDAQRRGMLFASWVR